MAQNEPPEIPSFKPKTDKEQKGAGAPLSSLAKPATPGAAPAAPGASPSSALPSFSKGSSGSGLWPNLAKGGSPKLRVRGLPGGATLVERLKNLRKKDLMFIGAGLSVLLMAPLAEHFMMTPQQDAGTLDAGFDRKGPLFPDGTSIYESGTGGFSPGGLVGSGTDVITPLNVRDPAALVMGPGATQKPAATVTPPPPTDAQPEKPSWKDALAQAANKGASAGISKAKPAAFKPDGKLAGALRGLSALSGASAGGGPSMKLEKLDATGVPNRARDSNSLSRTQAMPGYKGVASRSPSSGGGPESLKAAGQRQGDIFNKGGATGALDTAARTGIPGGGAGAGGGSPGDGDPSKNPSGSSNKDNKSLGESLALLRAKLEMQKALDLKWKKKEWKEFGKRKMIEEQVYKLAIENLLGKAIFEPVGKAIGKSLSQMLPGGEKYMACTRSADGKDPFVVPMSQVGDEFDKDALYYMWGNNLKRGNEIMGYNCSESGAGKPKDDHGRRERSTGNLPGYNPGGATGKDLNKVCEELAGITDPAAATAAQTLYRSALDLLDVRSSLQDGRASSRACGTSNSAPKTFNLVKGTRDNWDMKEVLKSRIEGDDTTGIKGLKKTLTAQYTSLDGDVWGVIGGALTPKLQAVETELAKVRRTQGEQDDAYQARMAAPPLSKAPNAGEAVAQFEERLKKEAIKTGWGDAIDPAAPNTKLGTLKTEIGGNVDKIRAAVTDHKSVAGQIPTVEDKLKGVSDDADAATKAQIAQISVPVMRESLTNAHKDIAAWKTELAGVLTGVKQDAARLGDLEGKDYLKTDHELGKTWRGQTYTQAYREQLRVAIGDGANALTPEFPAGAAQGEPAAWDQNAAPAKLKTPIQTRGTANDEDWVMKLDGDARGVPANLKLHWFDPQQGSRAKVLETDFTAGVTGTRKSTAKSTVDAILAPAGAVPPAPNP